MSLATSSAGSSVTKTAADMGQLARIVRHPIKAIGREELAQVVLSPGQCLPGDRVWAVAHEAAKFGAAPVQWAAKMNFLRGVSAPSLMAVEAQLTDGQIALSHPEHPPLTFDPGTVEGRAALIHWLRPMWPAQKPEPTDLVTVPDVAMTDVPDPWVSINSFSSLKALSQTAGQDLSPHRFRGNLWVDGLEPWAEFDWIGQEISIGVARLVVRQRITRCKATLANPETGKRDVDTLAALTAGWDHTDFGIYAEVISGGEVALGDPVSL